MVDVRGLDPRFAPSVRLSAVQFLSYTGSEIESISRKSITNPNTFDSLLHSNVGGLYDPALGPSDKQDLCGTCGLNYVHCPGHFGHISLPLPVYHPVFFANLYSLLRISCWNCHMLFCSPYRAHLLTAQLELIELGLLSEAVTLESELSMDARTEELGKVLRKIRRYVKKCRRAAGNQGVTTKTKNLVECRISILASCIKQCSGAKKCMHCLAPVRVLRHENRAKIFLKGLSKKQARAWMDSKSRMSGKGNSDGQDATEEVAVTLESLTKQSFLTPLEVKAHVKHLWENQRPLVSALIGCCVIGESEGDGDGTVASREGPAVIPVIDTIGALSRRGVDRTPASRCAKEISPADVFFLDVIPVPPSRFRPVSQSFASLVPLHV